METVEKVSLRFVKEFLPLIKDHAEWAYMLTMVITACKTSTKQWHRKNLFYSYLQALLFVRGADIITALCTGRSPMDSLAPNFTLFAVAVLWWLVLFSPFDFLNNILNFDLGDIKPFLLIINLMTIIRQMVTVDAAVSSSLSNYPGSYIAIFTATLAGNGCLIVSAVFGDFARVISNHKMTNTAFIAAVLITVTKILCPKAISAPVVFTFTTTLMLFLEILDAAETRVNLFDPLYDFIRRIVLALDGFDQ